MKGLSNNLLIRKEQNFKKIFCKGLIPRLHFKMLLLNFSISENHDYPL